MFEKISSMFSSTDPDAVEESDEPVDGDDPTGEGPIVDPAAGDPGENRDVLDEDVMPGSDEGSDGEEEPDVAELDVRLDELDDELSSTDASIRELRSSQEEMAESVEGMNDTVRQLVGIYDRIAAEENPFLEEPAGATTDTSSPIPGAGDSPESAASDSSWSDAGPDRDEGSRQPSAADDSGDEVVSFDDLQSGGEEASETLSPHSAEESSPEPQGVDDEPPSTQPSNGEQGPVLETIPDGYAGEVLVMEWLATLMDRSGPAGAFRAVDYYESVGWISPAVERRLVDVIGGPALDVFVDPTQPREPTAEEHAVSHEYLRVMARLNDI